MLTAHTCCLQTVGMAARSASCTSDSDALRPKQWSRPSITQPPGTPSDTCLPPLGRLAPQAAAGSCSSPLWPRCARASSLLCPPLHLVASFPTCPSKFHLLTARLQELAQSCSLQSATALRWSTSGHLLAVPCVVEGTPAVVILDSQHLGLLATISPSALAAGWLSPHPLDCVWLPKFDEVVIWAPDPRGWFQRYAIVDTPKWGELSCHLLPEPCCMPHWGPLWTLAATTQEARLVLFHILGSPLSLAVLPGVLPVARGVNMWPGLTAVAWHPSGRFVAAAFPAPGSEGGELSLALLDSRHAGACVWSYTLRGTSGAASPGLHHVAWSGDGLGLSVSITSASGFLQKWVMSFRTETSFCCKKGCQGAQYGTCPRYRSKAPKDIS